MHDDTNGKLKPAMTCWSFIGKGSLKGKYNNTFGHNNTIAKNTSNLQQKYFRKCMLIQKVIIFCDSIRKRSGSEKSDKTSQAPKTSW